MAQHTPPKTAPTRSGGPLFAAAAGAFLGLALLKFGNPVILDHRTERPGDLFQFLFQSWPMVWGYGLLVALVISGLPLAEFKTKIPPLCWVPIGWLGWQFIAAASTVDRSLTGPTLAHFTACVVCFYLGLLVLSRAGPLKWFGVAILAAFLLMLWTGFRQHYGGLEATRQFFLSQSSLEHFPPEYRTSEFLKKINSDRIFATLVYPNALAGVILLWLPMLLVLVARLASGWPRVWRGVAIGLLAYAALACLYWSGSKAGWLIALLLGLVALLHLPMDRRIKWACAVLALAGGLAGFAYKYSGYFQRGATSVSARVEYWEAAVKITRANPFTGSGPGTFGAQYQQLKRPEAEMAQLAHNDYLEQASDSGLPGFLLYFGLIWGSLALLYRHSARSGNWNRFAIWLGLFGWAVQGFVEFGLYIPALAWPAFLLLGWLWAKRETD